MQNERAYQQIQGSKPQSLGVGLNDSPAGLAAWIVEKFYAWTDCQGDLDSTLGRDAILTNIMLYWATGAIGSFGFHSQLPILDILGLVDATIARTERPPEKERFALPGHQRSNPDYVFSRKPDYILIGKRGKQRLGGLVTAPVEIRTHPDLDRYYEWDAEVLGYRRVR